LPAGASSRNETSTGEWVKTARLWSIEKGVIPL
jgi:hypothetical protein